MSIFKDATTTTTTAATTTSTTAAAANATTAITQGDHLSGKPGNVREFETCQGNVREKILSW